MSGIHAQLEYPRAIPKDLNLEGLKIITAHQTHSVVSELYHDTHKQ
jgi:hypothetical protein